jgi:phosphoribosylformylglycinamidine synthase
VVSGNVSFYNENPKGAINPTPTIGMIGILESLNDRMTSYFKNEGDAVILLGETKEELGGSEYLKVIHNLIKGDAPELVLENEKNLQLLMLSAIRSGLISSAHDCSEGGLAVALSECCIENKFGAQITNLNANIRADAELFGESQSRIVISCSQQNAAKVEESARKYQVPFKVIGKVSGGNLKISNYIDLPVDELEKRFKNAFNFSDVKNIGK